MWQISERISISHRGRGFQAVMCFPYISANRCILLNYYIQVITLVHWNTCTFCCYLQRSVK